MQCDHTVDPGLPGHLRLEYEREARLAYTEYRTALNRGRPRGTALPPWEQLAEVARQSWRDHLQEQEPEALERAG